MKKKEIIIFVIVLLVAAGLFAGSMFKSNNNDTPKDTASSSHDTTEHDSSGTAGTSTSETAGAVDLTTQSSIKMDIQNFAYTQPNIKIKKGTTVTWTNQDSVQHNVKQGLDSEITGKALAGPMLSKGQSYSFTFNDVGTLSYFCTPHPQMTGNITIVE